MDKLCILKMALVVVVLILSSILVYKGYSAEGYADGDKPQPTTGQKVMNVVKILALVIGVIAVVATLGPGMLMFMNMS